MINKDEGSIFDAMRDGIDADKRNFDKIKSKNPAQAAQVGAYVKQEFPKTLFGKGGDIIVVEDQKEMADAQGRGYFDHPDKAKTAADKDKK